MMVLIITEKEHPGKERLGLISHERELGAGRREINVDAF